MGNERGVFVISLDFELLWGVRDIMGPDEYGDWILGVFDIFPKMLHLFDKYDVSATFATVGFLFADSKREMERYFPHLKPNYLNSNLSPYNGHFKTVGNSEVEDRYHFATSLMNLLRQARNHEIASHTFSHYYCFEEGQKMEEFKADMEAAVLIAKDCGMSLRSLVFPRNQANEDYLTVCRDLGFTTYRGTEKTWFYNGSGGAFFRPFKRILRLADSYINLSGDNIYTWDEVASGSICNIPSSRFLRPHNPKLRMLESMRLNRIVSGMEKAAKKSKIYHLWWHPHNFGCHQSENLDFLEAILIKYKELEKKYQFRSLTMEQVGNKAKSLKSV